MTNASTEVELEKSLNESSLASQTFGTSQLELHARGLGSRLTVVSGGPELSKSFLIEFEDNVRAIESAHALSLVWAEGSELHSPVVDWLLDNYYIVSEQIRDIRDHMPRSFFRELPKLASGRARIHVLAEELVLHCDCSLDEELILRFAENFQSVAELTIGETWAFAVMLRLSLIERLRCLCDQLERDYQSILSIEPILKGLANEEKLSFADLSSVVNASALISLSRAIKELAGENVSARTMFDDHLEGTGWSLIELQKREQHRLASSQVSIGNIITSMRLLGVLDWTKIFEEINCSEKRLRSDPAQIYAQMDFDSRNRYRNAVESLAKNSTRSESSVVELALEYAKKKPTGELDQSIATVRSHVGYWLVDEGLSTIEEKLNCKPTYLSRTHRWIQQKPDQWYFGLTLAIVVFSCTLLVITLLAAGVGEVISVAIVLLAVIPVSEIALTIINAFFTHILPVQLLPKLSLESGVPSRFPTFVVVPSMLTSYRDAETLLSRIESHYLSNADDNLYFGLLTDFADCKVSEMENDQAILQAAIDGIRKLNRKYERLHQRTPFYLFHRQRVWNSSENKWMGWERKRGKLIEFHRLLLRNAPTNYVVQEGQLAVLEEFRDLNHRPFVITLDSDTILPRGAAKKMIGTLAHPLNQALELGDVGQHSRRGYSILQPRVSVHLGDETKSRYVQVFAHNPGLDPYSSAASDVYQDLFREGSFTGKGIYDLRSFDKSIEGIFPENRILSHDLVEGCHARVGLVTDIEVFDSFPTRYDIDAKRLHRWVRGDWQIAAWLFPTVPIEGGWRKNTLTLLSRWKILDNLRRSAIAPTLLSFLVVGWLLRPSQGWLFSICGALVIFFPVFIQCITSFVSMHRVPNRLAWLRATSSDLVRTLEQSIYAAAFLPHKALMMADAIVRTIFRLVVSKCNLLEWETASATESRLSQKKWAIVRQLSVCSIFAVILFLALNEPSKLAALPWLVLWTTAPLVGQLISLPKKLRRTQTSNPDSQFLLKVMSSTWGFFERFVGVDSHWLPPDNVQEYPREKIANRISPTNEGLFLVSGMAAHQFGFTSTTKLLEYWESNLDSWLSLEQMNGHHFNWYETSTPRVLTPRYVSTVDSGNLLACYLTLSSGIESLVKTPMLSRSHVDGALATIAWLRDIAAKSQGVMKKTPIVNSQHDWQRAFEEKLSEIELTFRVYSDSLYGMACFCRDLKIASDNLENWLAESDGVPQVDNFQTIVQIVADRFKSLSSDVRSILPWLDKFVSCVDLDQPFPNSLLHLSQLVTPQISLLEAAKLRNMLDLPSGRQFTDDDESINTTRDAVVRGSEFAEDLIERLYGVRLRCDEAAQEMDFKLLYNPRRKLFSIGLNADTGQLDRGHYDLLCSECRLSSFLAIAKGDVETEHWFRLGRQATSIDGRYALLSWGGSMFEYLMPTLFQRSYEGSLLDKSCRTAIQTQAEYGAKLDRPWGISESAYSAIGTNSDYQYKSFGVPGLGLKRGLSKDYVVSPYSTALALPYILADASKNLRSMANDAMGDWGFYDAIDYTRSRLRKKESFKVVQNYMAHHHGMSILAIANALNDNQVQKWFHANPLVRANELLLQERVPTYLVSNSPNPDETHETTAIHADTDYVSRHI